MPEKGPSIADKGGKKDNQSGFISPLGEKRKGLKKGEFMSPGKKSPGRGTAQRAISLDGKYFQLRKKPHSHIYKEKSTITFLRVHFIQPERIGLHELAWQYPRGRLCYKKCTGGGGGGGGGVF